MTNKSPPLSNQAAPWYELIKPRHWPSWIGIGFLYLLSRLPYQMQLSIGRGIGKLMYYLLKRRRRITLINLKLCFPERSEQKRIQLAKKTFSSVGIAIVETGISWWWSEKKLRSLFNIHHLEHAQNALKKGKGLIILGAHYTTLDIAGRLLSLAHPFYTIAREQNNLVVDAMLKRFRNKSNISMIHRYDIRNVIRSLKNNHIVWYAPDQDYGPKHSVFVPFFGVQTASITALVRLAKMSGAPVITGSYFRRSNNSGYDLVYHPVLENFPSNNMEADVARMNKILENIIRQHPEQYLWLHRRFKTRPKGEKGFY